MLRSVAATWKGVAVGLRQQFSASASASAASEAASSGTGLSPYFLFVPSTVCAFLAYWQYERKQWKEDLLVLRHQMLQSDAVDLFSLKAPAQYQKVSAAGSFMHDGSQFVGPRPRSINGVPTLGYLLITPMVSTDRRHAVMVNRGWVPASWKDDPEASVRGATGSLVVEGVVQPDETPSSFMPANRPDEGRFHSIDRLGLAEACGLPDSTELLLAVCGDPDASPPVEAGGHNALGGARSMPPAGANAFKLAPPDYPIVKHQDELLRFTVMPKDHMGYVVTWATLALALAVFARHVIVARPARINRFIDNRAAWEGRRGGSQ